MFTVPSILTRISYTADKGLNLGFRTNELSDDEKNAITALHNTFGWLGFQPNKWNVSDIPTVAAPDRRHSHSSRLRAVLFLEHKQQGGTKDNFQEYYETTMDTLIESRKENL